MITHLKQDTWAAGGIGLDAQSEAASGSEDQSKGVNNSPDDTAGEYLLSKQEENASLQAMPTEHSEDMVVLATAVMEEVVVGLKMFIKLEVEEDAQMVA